MYRLLAISLVFSSVMTIVGHVCMMEQAHAGPMVEACCCEGEHATLPNHTEHRHDEANTHAGDMHRDHGQHGHQRGHERSSSNHEQPCDDKQQPGEHAHDGCCAAELQHGATVATRTLITGSDVRVTFSDAHVLPCTVVALGAPLLTQKRAFQDIGPPVAPPFRILHSSFLI